LTDVTLPEEVAAQLHDDEEPRWYAQPIRPANGKWIWPVMALGLVFLATAAAALDDVVRAVLDGNTLQRVLGAAVLGLALAFEVFAVVLVAWPALAYRRMARTHVVVTGRRVVEVVLRGSKAPKVRAWDLAECTDVQRGMPRGRAASLVLRERVRERRTDGQTIYEWDALHGLPRVDEAVTLIRELRGEPAS
jgi:hypothetical protein